MTRYYITQHAVQQFRERIAHLPPEVVIQVVERGLLRSQHAFWAHGGCEGRQCIHQGTPFYPVVGPGEGPWPAVVTVLDEALARPRIGREIEAKQRLFRRLVGHPHGSIKDLQGLSGLSRWHVLAILAEWGVPVVNGRYGGEVDDTSRSTATAD